MYLLGAMVVAMMFVLVGKIWKPVKPKVDRIKRAGKLRRVCKRHSIRLSKHHMAVFDHNNCDYCKNIYLE